MRGHHTPGLSVRRKCCHFCWEILQCFIDLKGQNRYSWQVAGLWVRDQKGQTTVGQLLMEPMGPVCVCLCARTNALSPHVGAYTLQYNRDGNWLMITMWWTMTDRWIVMLMSRGSNWPLHFRIFKSQLSFLRWHMRIGAQSIYVQNNSILWKAHWPPGYLVQINNISSYHSWSLNDRPKWQPYVQ